MRKTINILALITFVWLVFDTFKIPDMIIRFIIVGELPGTDTSLSPSVMLALTTTIAGGVIFELLVQRISLFRTVHQRVRQFVNRNERFPRRRFGRI